MRKNIEPWSQGVPVRALCHYTRVMLGDRPMNPLTQDWDSITQSSSITLKASRVAECFNFDYQVTFIFGVFWVEESSWNLLICT